MIWQLFLTMSIFGYNSDPRGSEIIPDGGFEMGSKEWNVQVVESEEGTGLTRIDVPIVLP